VTDWQAPVLRLPYRGAPQTVGLIRESAHKAQQDVAVRQLAEAVCSGLPSKAYLDEYAALYRFVESRTRYMRDPRTVELVRSPSIIVKALWAGQIPQLDCDDMACLLCALVMAVGGKCRLATVAFQTMRYRGQQQFSHVFAQAYDPQSKAWVTLDPVASGGTDAMQRRVKHIKYWPVA